MMNAASNHLNDVNESQESEITGNFQISDAQISQNSPKI